MNKLYFILFFINVSVAYSQSNIFDACRKGSVGDIISINPNSINQVNEAGHTLLMTAVVKGDINIMKMLLERNTDTNITDVNETTSLSYATIFKQLEIVKLLIEAGDKADIRNAQ